MLIKLYQSINYIDTQKLLLNYIATIGSTNATDDQIAYILKQLKDNPQRVLPCSQFKNTIEVLKAMIVGEFLHNFFFFEGTSYISFESPSKFSNGYLCVMDIQIEATYNKEKQCLFSLVNTLGSKHKLFELFIEQSKLVYSFQTHSKIENIEFKAELEEKTNYLIILSHIEGEVFLKLNRLIVIENAPRIESIDHGYIGHSIHPTNNKPQFGFTGAISFIHFYEATSEVQSYKEELKRRNLLKGEILGLKDESNKRLREPRIRIDPSCYELTNESGNTITEKNNLESSIKKTENVKIFFNIPAKRVLANFGGFKTFLFLCYNRLLNKPSEYQ